MEPPCGAYRLLSTPIENNSFIITLMEVQAVYGGYHGPICLSICLFGIFANIINIIVLTRKQMRTSVNMVYTAIAVSDIGLMASYMVYVSRFNIVPKDIYNFYWMWFLMVHMYISSILHHAALWFNVAVAFIRINILRSRNPSSSWLSIPRAHKVDLIILVMVIMFCVPSMFAYEVIPYPYNQTLSYTVDLTASAYATQCALFRVVMWLYGIVFKTVPCVLLTCLIVALLHTMKHARERRQSLLNERRRRTYSDRTSVLLIIVVTVSLLMELPQAIPCMLVAVYPTDGLHIYNLLGDFLDLFSLINCSINFVIYCSMSTKYRTTFMHMALSHTLLAHHFPTLAVVPEQSVVPHRRMSVASAASFVTRSRPKFSCSHGMQARKVSYAMIQVEKCPTVVNEGSCSKRVIFKTDYL